MRRLSTALALTASTLALADTITLKNGKVISRTYLSGSSREIKLEVGDQIQNLNVGDISRIDFSAGPASLVPPQPQSGPSPTRPAEGPLARDTTGIELPTGTNLVVRMIDGVDSQVNRVGQTFGASLDEPVAIKGQTLPVVNGLASDGGHGVIGAALPFSAS